MYSIHDRIEYNIHTVYMLAGWKWSRWKKSLWKRSYMLAAGRGGSTVISR